MTAFKTILCTIAILTMSRAVLAATACEGNTSATLCHVEELRFTPDANTFVQAKLSGGYGACHYIKFVEDINNLDIEKLQSIYGLLITAYTTGIGIQLEYSTVDGSTCFGESLILKK